MGPHISRGGSRRKQERRRRMTNITYSRRSGLRSSFANATVNTAAGHAPLHFTLPITGHAGELGRANLFWGILISRGFHQNQEHFGLLGPLNNDIGLAILRHALLFSGIEITAHGVAIIIVAAFAYRLFILYFVGGDSYVP